MFGNSRLYKGQTAAPLRMLRTPVVYPLDEVTGVTVAAAFASRVLTRNWLNRPLMRVRRSSDGAQLDIGSVYSAVDNCFVLDTGALLAFTGSNSATVVTWYDQSGRGISVTQATPALQPRIVNAGVVDTLNGKPSPFGTGQHLLAGAAPMANTAELTACVVMRPTTFVAGTGGPTPFSLFSNVNTTRVLAHLPWSDGVVYFDVGAQTGTARVSGSLGLTANNAYVAALQNSVTQSRQIVRSNGVQRAADTSALSSPVDVLQLFGVSGFDWSPRGPVSEFLFFSSNMTTAQIQTIERNQGAFYGITVP